MNETLERVLLELPVTRSDKSKTLAELLAETAARHPHLCPRQVLGVRMGMYAGTVLGLELPQADKRLFTFVETDGCFADGIAVATNCWVGRRTLRIEDYGKVAATFVDTELAHVTRLSPHPRARQLARQFAPEAESKWEAMLLGYQRMPDEALFQVQAVHLNLALDKLISRPGHRVICQSCGEEILNEREIVDAGGVLCRACAGNAYYTYDKEPQELTAPRPPERISINSIP